MENTGGAEGFAGATSDTQRVFAEGGVDALCRSATGETDGIGAHYVAAYAFAEPAEYTIGWFFDSVEGARLYAIASSEVEHLSGFGRVRHEQLEGDSTSTNDERSIEGHLEPGERWIGTRGGELRPTTAFRNFDQAQATGPIGRERFMMTE
jgi:hypothetical protein